MHLVHELLEGVAGFPRLGALDLVFGWLHVSSSLSRPITAEVGVDGYFYRYQKHFVYWKRLADGDIGIVTILHQCMHQIERFRDDFGGKS